MGIRCLSFRALQIRGDSRFHFRRAGCCKSTLPFHHSGPLQVDNLNGKRETIPRCFSNAANTKCEFRQQTRLPKRCMGSDLHPLSLFLEGLAKKHTAYLAKSPMMVGKKQLRPSQVVQDNWTRRRPNGFGVGVGSCICKVQCQHAAGLHCH